VLCSGILLYYGGKNPILFAQTEGILKHINWTKEITNSTEHRCFEKLIVAQLVKDLSDAMELEVSLNSLQDAAIFQALRNVLWYAVNLP